LKVATSVRIVLVSRAGFTAQLQDIAQRRGDLTLVDGPTALAPLA
jgi:hypothetical protein